jgi:hypothetical protein
MDQDRKRQARLTDDWRWLDALAGKLNEDFAQAANEQPDPQERPALDQLFRWGAPPAG